VVGVGIGALVGALAKRTFFGCSLSCMDESPIFDSHPIVDLSSKPVTQILKAIFFSLALSCAISARPVQVRKVNRRKMRFIIKVFRFIVAGLCTKCGCLWARLIPKLLNGG